MKNKQANLDLMTPSEEVIVIPKNDLDRETSHPLHH